MTDIFQDLRRDEGVRNKPYKCTADKLTIGVGRNLEDVGLSNEEIEFLLQNDVKRVRKELAGNFPWYLRLSPNRQRALENMCFNLGIRRLKGFRKMLTALELGQLATAAAEALDSKWARQVGARADRIAVLIKEG